MLLSALQVLLLLLLPLLLQLLPLLLLLPLHQELLAMTDWTDWHFVLNLSESDFPVKTQEELVAFLSANR